MSGFDTALMRPAPLLAGLSLSSAILAVVATGATVSKADVTFALTGLQPGAMLRVHVNDPQAALSQAQGGNPWQYADQSRQSAAAGASGFDDYLIGPFDETRALATQSASVALRDQNGNASGGRLAPVVLNVALGAVAK
jgi:hypothetical protein